MSDKIEMIPDSIGSASLKGDEPTRQFTDTRSIELSEDELHGNVAPDPRLATLPDVREGVEHGALYLGARKAIRKVEDACDSTTGRVLSMVPPIGAICAAAEAVDNLGMAHDQHLAGDHKAAVKSLEKAGTTILEGVGGRAAHVASAVLSASLAPAVNKENPDDTRKVHLESAAEAVVENSKFSALLKPAMRMAANVVNSQKTVDSAAASIKPDQAERNDNPTKNLGRDLSIGAVGFAAQEGLRKVLPREIAEVAPVFVSRAADIYAPAMPERAQEVAAKDTSPSINDVANSTPKAEIELSLKDGGTPESAQENQSRAAARMPSTSFISSLTAMSAQNQTRNNNIPSPGRRH